MVAAMRVPSASWTMMLAGSIALAGCASLRHDGTAPPDIEISAIAVDAASGSGTVVVTNHARRRVLIRTNDLVWQGDATIRRVPRPDLDFGDDAIVLTHDARLGAGESREYMVTPAMGALRRDHPAVHVCWDNRNWTCEDYWLVPAKASWSTLIGNDRPMTWITAVHARLQEVEKQTADDARERARQMAKTFDRDLATVYAPARLATATDEEVEQLFQAANRVVFYAHEPRHATLLAHTADMLETRSLLTDKHRRDLYRGWVVTRRFEQANALARAHPALQLPVLPPVPMAGSAAAGQVVVWRPADDAETLSAQTVDLDVPTRVVVLSHPRCGFSQRAIAAIEADPALSARLHDALWLAPPNGSLDLADVQAWNRVHPGARLSYAVAMHDWPQFDSWATPVFYFMREGRVVATVTGWPKEGRARELHQAFAQMDALEDP